MRTARRALGAGLLGVGLLTAWEVAAVARVVRREDQGGREDHAWAIGTGLGEPLRLLLLGDSAVDGYGLTAAEALPRHLATRVAVATGRRVEVRSLALSGATTADVAASQVPLLRAAGGVDAVLVGVGVNDVLKRTPGAVLESATRDLVLGLQAVAPDAALAYIVCHDLSTAPGLGPVLRRIVGRRCRAVARRQQDVLDELLVPVVPVDGPGLPELFGEDGLHPGRAAVEVIAQLATATLVASSDVPRPVA